MLFWNLNRLWVIVLGSALSWAAAAQAPVPRPPPPPPPSSSSSSQLETAHRSGTSQNSTGYRSSPRRLKALERSSFGRHGLAWPVETAPKGRQGVDRAFA